MEEVKGYYPLPNLSMCVIAELSHLTSAGIRLENDMPKYRHFLGHIKDVDSSFRIRWLYNVSSDSLYIIICDSAANAHLSLLATKLRL